VHSCGNPAIHTGHLGNGPGISPAICPSRALGASHQTLACTFVSLYVGEALLVNEELANTAAFPVIVPEFGPTFNSILSLHVY
jgi:hypothetical protein